MSGRNGTHGNRNGDEPTNSTPADDVADASAQNDGGTPAVRFSVVFDDGEDEGTASARIGISPILPPVESGDAADHDLPDDEAGASSNKGTADENPADDAPGNDGSAVPSDASAHAATGEDNAHADSKPGNQADDADHDAARGHSVDRAAEGNDSGHDDTAMDLASQMDHRLDRDDADDILLTSYPTFALDHVTVTNRKSGRHVLENIQWPFHDGMLYAIALDDEEQHQALFGILAAFTRPDSGQVMLKSTDIAQTDILQIRKYRIGVIPQRYDLRDDLDASGNIQYAIRASGRTFLKPASAIARDLLGAVGFSSASTGIAVRDLSDIDRRRAAIARAISCEAPVIIIDEPTSDLDAEDRRSILALLKSLAHSRDPRRCMIMLTSEQSDMDAADQVYEL